MIPNINKRLDAHKFFLKLTRQKTPKELEGLYVYFLRGSEKLCKVFDNFETAKLFGLTQDSYLNITYENYIELYRLNFAYFTVVLDNERIPGTYEQRKNVTESIIGERHLDMFSISSEKNDGSNVVKMLSELTPRVAVTYAEIFGLDSFMVDEFSEILEAVVITDIGLNAMKLSSKRGCYIATLVYNSYDAPEVIVLRNFRDEKLDRFVIGRILIKVYYSISLKLIKYKLFGNFLIRPTKSFLNLIVKLIK